MMKKIISLTFGLLMTMAAWGQSSAAVDTLTPAQDSVSIGSHTEFAAAKISDDTAPAAPGPRSHPARISPRPAAASPRGRLR